MAPAKRELNPVMVWFFRVSASMLILIGFLFSAEPAFGESATIGVFVDQPDATAPPSRSVTAPETEESPTLIPEAPIETLATLPDVLPPIEQIEVVEQDPDAVEQDPETVDSNGVIETVKDIANSTKQVLSDIIGGKPVAEALQEVLPQAAAEVFIPAVRTASTFAFPIGLGVAAIGFLFMQQRIDASDPKLNAAPLAHDISEVIFE